MCGRCIVHKKRGGLCCGKEQQAVGVSCGRLQAAAGAELDGGACVKCKRSTARPVCRRCAAAASPAVVDVERLQQACLSGSTLQDCPLPNDGFSDSVWHIGLYGIILYSGQLASMQHITNSVLLTKRSELYSAICKQLYAMCRPYMLNVQAGLQLH